MADLKTFGGDLSGKGGKLTILHKLNQQAGKWYLNADKFAPNIKSWDKVPVIFAKDHPTVRAMSDLKGALESCGGKLMGYPSNVRLEGTGHPKLLADLPINDAVAQSYYDRGILSPSTGFDAEDDGSHLTSDVIPDHILLFPEDSTHKPGDPASMMFQEPIPTWAGEIKGMVSKIFTKITNSSSEATDMDEKEMKAFQEKMAEQLKTFEAEKLALNKTIEEKDKLLKEFLAKAEQEKKDNTWKTMTATGKVPKGWLTGKVKQKVDGKDVEIDRAAETRKEFEADPASFAIRILKFQEQNGDVGANAGEGAGEENAPPAADVPAVKTIGAPQDWDDKTGQYK